MSKSVALHSIADVSCNMKSVNQFGKNKSRLAPWRLGVAVVTLATYILLIGSLRAADAELVAPDDLPALKAHLGQVVEIKAAVTGVGQSPTGNVLFVNFVKKAHSGVTAVYFTSGGRAGNVKSLDELKPFVGKTVSIKGELTAFKDDVQMVLQSVDDLHVVNK